MKIFFVAVFDDENKSTNNAQLKYFKQLGHNTVPYNFRVRASQIGNAARDDEIVRMCESEEPDLVLISKGAEISKETFRRLSDSHITAMWYMDPLTTLSEELKQKAALCDLVYTAKPNTVSVLKEYCENTFLVCEGYDDEVHYPESIERDIDVSFIGALYTPERREIINYLKEKVGLQHYEGVYADEHRKIVSRSKISLNISTASGESDRVYKIMGTGTTLLTTDWTDREKHFKNEKDLLVFKNKEEAEHIIKIYLSHDSCRLNMIADNGLKAAKSFTKRAWADKIVKIYEEYECES